VTGALAAKLNEMGLTLAQSPLEPARLAALIAEVDTGAISGPIGKDVFAKMFTSGRTAPEIIAADGLKQIDDDSQIASLVAEVLASHPDPVAQYRSGKTTAFGFLVGQVMKAAGGKANPKRVNAILKQALEA
jgi:aspartyl-tRNA(Asn)/glutamyl-tRNA(Gln) amidotransferase subunit B